MPLNLVTVATYPSSSLMGSLSSPKELSDEMWHSKKLISAIKGDSWSGYAWIPIGGVRRKLTLENAHLAVKWFGEMAKDPVSLSLAPDDDVTIVPLPASTGTSVQRIHGSVTWRLAEALAKQVPNSTVEPVLTWRTRQQRARDGGPRNAEALFPELCVDEFRKNLDKLIIVDDVTTTGGHIQAAAAALEMFGDGGDVDLVVCAGRTVERQIAAPFDPFWQEISDYNP